MKICLTNQLFLIYFIFFLSSSPLICQSLEIRSYESTKDDFLFLNQKNGFIHENDSINECILDLVQASVVDSMVNRKKQHHKVGPIGFLIHIFGGFNWRAYELKKQKIVGTVSRQSRSREEQYTEYDINFDLQFNLDHYLNKILGMYDAQTLIKRQDIRKNHKRDYNKAPYTRDPNNIDRSLYKLHCELTPASAFRTALNYFFYPTLPGKGRLEQHPNFMYDYPSVGFYGLLCLDCNHSCHPEMHPYEWMWSMNLSSLESNNKEWNIGFFHESSNRMIKWSAAPKIGKIKIPFIFHKDSLKTIEILHGVIGKFNTKDPAIYYPSGPIEFKATKKQIIPLKAKKENFEIIINMINPINEENLNYWLSDLNLDPSNGFISGYLNLSLSVYDVFTTKIIFK